MSRVRPSLPHVLQSLNVNLKRLGFAPGQPGEEWSADCPFCSGAAIPIGRGALTLFIPLCLGGRCGGGQRMEV